MELFKAHYQWATRPEDQRFADLDALYTATKAYAATAAEKVVPFNSLRAEAVNGEVVLVGKNNYPAQLTHWSFGQLCARVEAPANYLRELPATLAVQNINHGFKKLEKARENRQSQLLFHQNGGLLCRSLNGEEYTRVWNWEIAQRLLRLQDQGWEPARPDFNKSDADFPALYASDHDMFAFVRLPNVTLQQPVVSARSEAPLYRGAIYENSEVGARAIHITRFWYNGMCGNHIIWGASNVVELSARHTGNVRSRLATFDVALRRYAEDSASDDQQLFSRAANVRIAGNREEVIDRLFGLRAVGLSRVALNASYDAVLPEKDGDPRTVWGMAQGITRHSQTIPYADQRNELDRAAGRVLSMVDKF